MSRRRNASRSRRRPNAAWSTRRRGEGAGRPRPWCRPQGPHGRGALRQRGRAARLPPGRRDVEGGRRRADLRLHQERGLGGGGGGVVRPRAGGELSRRRKRSGHTLSKGRFIGAQVEALLLPTGTGWSWPATPTLAADALAATLTALPGVRLGWPVEANEVFAIMPLALADRLNARGVACRRWHEAALAPGTRPPRARACSASSAPSRRPRRRSRRSRSPGPDAARP